METKALSKIELWFFRDLNSLQRQDLFRLFSLPTEEIKTHSEEQRCLKYVLAALSAQGEAAQPAAEGWEIDRSTASPILVYEKCSVIQDEQAFYLMRLIQADQAASPAASQDGGGGKHQCIHYPSHRCTCEPGRSLCLKPEDAAIYHGDIDGDSEI